MKYIYRFNISHPANVDGRVIHLVRYRMGTDNNVLGQDVLTVDGWQQFEQWDVIDLGRLPIVSGIDMLNETKCQERLDQWEEHIRTMIGSVVA